MADPDITILVPTRNRPRELLRLLSFLDHAGSRYPVGVLDGSDPAIQEMNVDAVRRFAFARHEAYAAESHLGMRCADALTRTRTPYMVFCADDDFVFPAALEECARFLDANPDHSAVLGNVLSLTYFKDKPVLRDGVLFDDAFRFVGYTAQDRFLQRALYFFAYAYLGTPPLYYGLRRTGVAREAFGHLRASMKYSAMELLSNTITLIRGKVAILPTIFGLRDYSCPATSEPIRDDPRTYLSADDIETLRPSFVAALAESENITTDIAARDIDLYLTQWAPRGWSSPHLASRPLTRARKLGMGLRLMESIFHPAALAARHGLPLATVSCLLRAQRAFVRDDARRPPASTG